MSMPSRPQPTPRSPVSMPAPPPAAPTLLQFWRSDVHTVPGRRRPRWAGLIAFWLGLVAMVLYLFDMAILGGPGLLAYVASPLSVVAFLFGLVAVVAGIGRGFGVFGLIFAVLGQVQAWAFLGRLLS
jgi:hypothetical protein